MNILDVEGVVSKEVDVTNNTDAAPAQKLAWFTFETLRLHGKHARQTCKGQPSIEYYHAERFAKRSGIDSTHFTGYLAELAGVPPNELTGGRKIRMYASRGALGLQENQVGITYQLQAPELELPVIRIAHVTLHKENPNSIATFSNCLVEGEGNISLAHAAIAALRADAKTFRRSVLSKPYVPS